MLVKDVPEEQREEVMTQMARQKQRTVARSQDQHQTKGTRSGFDLHLCRSGSGNGIQTSSGGRMDWF